jgi:hypothetical protein
MLLFATLVSEVGWDGIANGATAPAGLEPMSPNQGFYSK